MENKKPQIVHVDGIEWDASKFTEKQALFFNHCVDLDRKIASTEFQLQQLQVGKDAMFKLLKAELEPAEKVEAEAVN